jgi:hypothetical protein
LRPTRALSARARRPIKGTSSLLSQAAELGVDPLESIESQARVERFESSKDGHCEMGVVLFRDFLERRESGFLIVIPVFHVECGKISLKSVVAAALTFDLLRRSEGR